MKHCKTKFRLGDKVKIIAGNNRGYIGRIVSFYKDKVKISGYGLRRKFKKTFNKKIKKFEYKDIRQEKTIHISNIMAVSKENIVSRLKAVKQNKNKYRILIKSGSRYE